MRTLLDNWEMLGAGAMHANVQRAVKKGVFDPNDRKIIDQVINHCKRFRI